MEVMGCFKRAKPTRQNVSGQREFMLQIFYLRSCCFAQDAASETTGSGSEKQRSASGMNERSLLLPIAINAFRRRPERLVRFTGEPRNFSRKSSSEISASHASAGFTNPSRA